MSRGAPQVWDGLAAQLAGAVQCLKATGAREVRLGPWQSAALREESFEAPNVTGFAAVQHNIWFGSGKTDRRIKSMTATTFLITVAALVAVNIAARSVAGSGRFDGLPRPPQID